jgi:predicted phage terminase large subunit-like protein
VSYADDLAKKFSNDCRAVMRSPWYRGTFPAAAIDKAKDTETEFQTTKRGYRLATSVGGTLTGRGGDLIIIDDPIKPQDAQSKSVREKTVQWYENTLLSRLDDKRNGSIVLVMQRLHMDDLTGHLLAKGGFELLCLPAIAEKKEIIQLGPRVHVRQVDEVLDPIREPRTALDQMRKGMTPLVFSAQYQQRPIPLAGNLIKREWIKFFPGSVPWRRGEYYVTSWDTAMKSSERADFSVGTVWQVQDGGQNAYLIDLVRGRFEFPELVKAAVSLHCKWGFLSKNNHNLIIEDKGSGTSLIQALKRERIYAHPHNMKLEGDKIMRLEAQTAHFSAGVVHFLAGAPWLDDLMEELLAFPGVRHDDQVDSVSQALAFITWVESHRVTFGRVIV